MGENEQKVSLIPLGGLGEIGKNMLAMRYGNNILVIDAGLIFPEDEMLGVDIVIPDITYLLEHKSLVRAIVLTHGHEDHIGALPYVLRELNVPVYGSRLTLGLLEGKLREFQLDASVKLNQVRPRDVVKIGPFKVEFIHVNHSIADAMAVAVQVPAGTILYTGDFKFDQTPVDGELTDFARFTQLGDAGVLVLLADSTNVERPGYTLSEREVGRTFEDLFRQAKGRILVASFASHVPRIQQVINTAYRYGRKVAVTGRSMQNVVSIAADLGYLVIPPGTLIDLEEINSLPKDEAVILTTGSQGEPMSALSRIAASDHKQVGILPGDTVVISATPIPGNEKTVARTVDQLFRLGADVVHEAISGVHVSGHGSQEELKLMLGMVRPKFFVPVHGEYRMLVKHARLAQEMGIPESNVFVVENGQVLEVTRTKASLAGRVTAGRVMVDGLGVGDVGNIVLRDRKQLALDGIVIVVITLNKESGAVVSGPDIVSRGFVYVRESEPLLEEARSKVIQIMERYEKQKVNDWSNIKAGVRDCLGKFLFEKTRRRPMIIPIIMEV